MTMSQTAFDPYSPPGDAGSAWVRPLFRPLRTLALWSCWLYGVSMVLMIPFQFALAPAATAIEQADEFIPSQHAPILVGLLLVFVGMAMWIASFVTFLCWKYRAASNAWILDGKRMQLRPGISVGGYFIPLANFYLPWRAMRDIQRVSTGGSGMSGAWWALHLTSILGPWFTGWDDTTFEMRPADMLWLAVNLAATVVTILLVLKITRAQEGMNAGIGNPRSSDA